MRPERIVAVTAATLAALLVSSWPGSLVGLPVGAAAGFAAWRLWGDRMAWSAALVAGIAASALHMPYLAAVLASLAIVAAGQWPRWGTAAVGAACLALRPSLLAVGALGIGLLLAFVPPRLAAARQGRPELVLRSLTWAAALGLVVLSFGVPVYLSKGPGPALGIAALAAAAWASAVAAVVAWRAQDGSRMAWSLVFLVPLPFLAAPFLHVGVAPAVALFAAVAAVQIPVPLQLLAREMPKGVARVTTVAAGVGWGAAVALLGFL